MKHYILPIFGLLLVLAGCTPKHMSVENGDYSSVNGQPTSPQAKSAFDVAKTYCLNCHNNGVGGPTWGNIQTAEELNTFAYNGSSRIVPGDSASSILMMRIKFGPGDQSMPPSGESFTVEHYTILRDWIQGLPPLALPPPPPPTPPPPGGGALGVAKSNREKLRLGDRRFVASVLTGIFGTSVKPTTDSLILSRLTKFGGACDEADSFAHLYPVVTRCDDPGINLTSKQVNVDLENIYAPRIPVSTLDREGFRVAACRQILLGDNTALIKGIERVRGNSDLAFLDSTPMMTESEIQKAYALFYPGRSVKPRILSALMSVSAAAQQSGLESVGGNGTKFESWRFVFYTLCKSPEWQLE